MKQIKTWGKGLSMLLFAVFGPLVFLFPVAGLPLWLTLVSLVLAVVGFIGYMSAEMDEQVGRSKGDKWR